MSVEFTGERVIPGRVDPDLWNEHYSRYAFAARCAAGKRVLDLACGSGYGSALLAGSAQSVVGLDYSYEAALYAGHNYRLNNTSYAAAQAQRLPFCDASFDLVVAFEIIEHLADWRLMLIEARRVLASHGQLIVSTPNRVYYAKSREPSGPNPYHQHEFEFDEFRRALAEIFTGTRFYLQNHAPAIVFQPVETASGDLIQAAPGEVVPQTSHFFIAVCGMTVDHPLPRFVYLPRTGNVLQEREAHVAKLQEELAQKDRWLADIKQDHEKLVQLFRAQSDELDKRAKWISELDARLTAAGESIAALQRDLASEQEAAKTVAGGYETKIQELEEENRAKTEWAQETERRLTAELNQRGEELKKCVNALHDAEALAEERTRWALTLQQSVEQLEQVVSMVKASRWMKAGRAVGLGPRIWNK